VDGRYGGYVSAHGVPEGSGNHHCWIFDEPAGFHDRVRSFLAEGLRNNERVWYVGDAAEDVLLGQVRAIGFDDAVARGAGRVIPVAEAYAGIGRQPQEQIDDFARILAQSLADGFAGMRIAADATSLVQSGTWLRYEHLVDRFMIGRAIAGLCGFDARRLDPGRLAELECLHPVTNTATTSFRLTACAPTGDQIALSGELDLAAYDLLVRALATVDLQPSAGSMTVEVGGLAFADHRSLLTLARYAADRDAELILRRPRPGLRRIVAALGELPDAAAIRMEGAR
jgi:hypothetical protein